MPDIAQAAMPSVLADIDDDDIYIHDILVFSITQDKHVVLPWII